MKALVLSGGGSKGSYQIGVWKALRKLHIKYDIITGTSVGALNGALMTQNTYFKAVNVWKHINLKVLFGEDTNDCPKDLDIYKLYGKNFFENGGLDVKDLETIISKAINKRKFMNSKINFGLVTYNVSKQKKVELQKNEIKEDKIVDYLMASASCYPAFKKKDIEGMNYIDGGYRDNLPINLAIKMGATDIISVDLKAPGMKQITKKKVNITTIKPNNKLTNFLNFYEEGNMRNMRFGYNDTMKVFNKLEGNKYTFKLNTTKKLTKRYQDTYKHIMNEIITNDKMKKAIKEIINIAPIENERIEEKATSLLMESIAQELNLDETKIYNCKTLNKEIKKKLKKNEINYYEKEMLNNLYKKDYSSIRKQVITHPFELLKAVYLYTICED